MSAKHLKFALLLALPSALLLACTSSKVSSGGSTTSASDATSSTASPSETTSSSTNVSSTESNAITFTSAQPAWWSGFEISLESASYAPTDHQATVLASVRNTGAIETSLGATRSRIAVRASGRVATLSSPTTSIPNGASVPETLVFSNVPDPFSLASAELVFGEDDQHQAVFPLNGSPPIFDAIRALPAKPTLSARHTSTTYRVTSVRLAPAQCSGTNTRDVAYLPVPKTKIVLELIGTLKSVSTSRGGVAAQSARAVGSDGLSVPSEPILSEVLGATAATLENLHLCFALPATTRGPIDVAVDTRLVGEDFRTSRVTIRLP